MAVDGRQVVELGTEHVGKDTRPLAQSEQVDGDALDPGDRVLALPHDVLGVGQHIEGDELGGAALVEPGQEACRRSASVSLSAEMLWR